MRAIGPHARDVRAPRLPSASQGVFRGKVRCQLIHDFGHIADVCVNPRGWPLAGLVWVKFPPGRSRPRARGFRVGSPLAHGLGGSREPAGGHTLAVRDSRAKEPTPPVFRRVADPPLGGSQPSSSSPVRGSPVDASRIERRRGHQPFGLRCLRAGMAAHFGGAPR